LSSKRRLKRNQCRFKHKYSNEDIALKARKELKFEKQISVSVYKCAFCKKWHLGHSKGNRLKELNNIIEAII